MYMYVYMYMFSFYPGPIICKCTCCKIAKPLNYPIVTTENGCTQINISVHVITLSMINS